MKAVRVAPLLRRLTHRGRARTVAIWAGSALALYAILGFLVAPPIARSQLERNLSELLGRSATVERVRINPFLLSASVRGLRVKTREGDADAFAFDELYLDISASSLFRFAPVIEAARLTRPTVRFVRYEDKSYSFQDVVERLANRPPSPPGPTPRFAVYNISITDGRIEIDDRPEKAQHVVSDLHIGIPFISSLPSQIDINVQPRLTAKVNGTDFDLGGETKPLKDTRETKLRIDIDDLQIGKYLEYSPVPLRVRIPSASLSTRLELSLATDGEKLHTLTLSGNVRLQKFAAQKADGTPLLAVDAVDVDIDTVDFINRRAAIRSIRVDAPKVDVVRGKDGRLNWAALAPEAPAGREEPNSETPFPFTVGDIALTRGTVRVVDESTEKPFRFALDNIALGIEGLSNATGTKAAVRFAGDTGARGRLAVDGTLALSPLLAAGRIDLANLQIGAFAPYIEEKLKILVSGGVLSTRGQLVFDSPEGGPVRLGYRADASVANFATLDQATSQDLLRWKSLAVRGVDFELSPLKVAVDQVTLSDFYSRLIVKPDGTLNLQGLVKEAPKEAGAAESPASGPPPQLRLGRIELRNGNVNFSDYFIKPNYTIELTGVAGSVTEMTPQKPGDVDLRGRIHQTAPLEIAGRVNSLSKDLFVDLKADARDIELSPLTPYSVKYVGYGIQKGKLSVKLAYLIDQRKLSAQNNVYLDQFTFGERVESPTATTLPVLFAVALLKDKNGVIDVDLPISGSLDDPEFSVGGIVVKALVNLVTKAVTAPFALLGAIAGGGGEELAFVEYAPGAAALDADDEKRLRALAKALEERPGLKLEISGRIEPEADRDALKRAAVDRQVKAAKLRDAGGKTIDEVTVAPDEYGKYLTSAYRAAKFERPRNVLGLLKDLPVPEMERLMLAHAEVGEGELRDLANARAQSAKAWLVETGKIAAERVFIVSPKSGAEGIKDQGKPTRADFSLK